MNFSDRILSVEGSKAAKMSARAANLIAKGHQDVISLAVGEPGFNSPQQVKDAAKKAIDNNRTNYTAVDGIPELKEAIAHRYNRDYDLNVKLDEICVTTGAKHSLHNIFSCILNPEDEVVFFSPYWTSYPDMIKLSSAKPVVIETTHHNDFQFSEAQLREKLNRKTKLLILNIPHNPTGITYSKETLEILAKALKDYPDVWVVSDDIYDMLYWGQKPLTLLEVAPELRARYIIVNGVSKSYAMAGWRIGYVIGPSELANMVKKFQSQTASCACSISQYAAIEAFYILHQELRPQLENYQQRVEICYHELVKHQEISCPLPTATFYLFPYVKPTLERLGYENDLDFCLDLLQQKHLAIMPGSAFGAPDYLRLSCADDVPVLQEAMARFNDFIRQK